MRTEAAAAPFTLHPEDDLSMLAAHSRLVDKLLPAATVSRSALLQHLLPAPAPVATTSGPPLPLPLDVVTTPSHFVGSLPVVTAAGLPIAASQPSVDATVFSRRVATCGRCGTAVGAVGVVSAGADGSSVVDGTHSESSDSVLCAIRSGVDVVVGTAGRMAPEKNMGVLIHGYAIARRQWLAAGVKTRLVIVRACSGEQSGVDVYLDVHVCVCGYGCVFVCPCVLV